MPRISTQAGVVDHPAVSREEWLAARRALLAEEKALFREHDRLKAKRRALPWVKVDKTYVFDGPKGKESLADLFADKHQLLVYHFMFSPRNDAGCAHCSFWADHYDGPVRHLAQRDTNFVAISRAPLRKINAFKRRMGWKFKWLSSGDTDFNMDFHASFTPDLIRSGRAMFNFVPVDPSRTGMEDREGLSAFYRDEDGTVYHTYSTFARGIDLLNTTYNLLDLTAKGRDERPGAAQDWVRYHDRYPAPKAPPRRTRTTARRRKAR